MHGRPETVLPVDGSDEDMEGVAEGMDGDQDRAMTGTCRAAVPLTLRDYTGRMVGGDPVIETETATDYWAECGEPSVAVHEYRCEHGHVVRRETCPAHPPQPGTVGCRQCYDSGHECGMQVTEL